MRLHDPITHQHDQIAWVQPILARVVAEGVDRPDRQPPDINRLDGTVPEHHRRDHARIGHRYAALFKIDHHAEQGCIHSIMLEARGELAIQRRNEYTWIADLV